MRTVRGAALVLVLWLLVLLASIVGAFALTARVEQLQGSTGVDLLRGVQAAQAALDWAVYRLGQPPQPGQPALLADGRPHPWQFAGMAVEVSVRDESAKIDINQADAGLLAALMVQLGVEQARAQRLAAAITDWRDSDQLPQPAARRRRSTWPPACRGDRPTMPSAGWRSCAGCSAWMRRPTSCCSPT